ncbi:site-specific DNA-methyltransferase [Ruminococcus sp. HUN007]|uniref:site-specific DNA-methyltransferase n=1 Tax=Ruminococcus sp. HUN007 TaxID=1514668 RepID=UPI0005D1EE98|nr:site-specific DNA-methyltransferase [Ruminococcus sp. HUN007]
MDKMKMESPNLTEKNIEKIGALFPNCITETSAENGKLKKAIDFEKLRAMLSEDIAEGDESYEFTWVGKKAAIAEANRPIRKTLRPCKEESVNWETTENLYIEGDNLEVLKLLQESYLGKVKMIYIDPPYNTGNDFIYRDDFTMTSDDYAEESGQLDEDGNRLFKNTDSNGRFHSDWCSMIYSRLILARNLLADDGVIFISIDDNEIDSLKQVCNEVFGEINMVAQIPWQSRASIQNDTDFSVNHEYICVYAKNRRQENRRLKESNVAEWMKRDSFVCRPLPLDKDKYDNPDNDSRGLWKADPFDAPNIRPNLTYEIVNPITGEKILPPNGRHWRMMPEKFQQALADGRIVWTNNGLGKPQLKVFYEEKKDFGSVDNSWFTAERIGTSTNGTKELMKLFGGESYFDTPKPVSMLYKLCVLGNTSDGDIILDFFSGSATTAHAVMQLNAEDGGHRKFIMVQLPEKTDESSEAFKAGYKNICEIGKERIRRAGAKIKSETGADIDYGFRVLKLDDTNMEDVYYTPAETTQQMLDGFESNIKPDRTDLDLLFGCLLEWGLPLSMPYKSEKIENVTVHTYNDGDLIACFEKNVSENVIKTIAKRQPLRAVFRDDCFADSPAKINVGEIFKMLSPDTRVKVI